ncbi:MAG: nitrous oxide reductase family maturation protein NosD [Paracoccaceae bacterium]|nr:nitrous oxide reductase family maturation protein NosD [Paracoccaceae bacterium]
MLRHWFMSTLFCLPGVALAGTVNIAAEPGALADALKTAEAGQVLRLGPGRHDGGLTLSVQVALDCAPGAEIVGPGAGSVLTLDAPGIHVFGCTISGSGSSGQDIDSGIKLTENAQGGLIEGNHLVGNLYGIDIHGAENAVVKGNIIEGRSASRMNDRGNGVHVWNAPGTVVTDNDISLGRDGIFVSSSTGNEFTNNRFHDLRFAVHYMYAHDSLVAGNVSAGNHLGFAVMYSDRVVLRDNLSLGDRDHGVMLNYTNESLIFGNRVEGGPEKCIFIYNAHKNRIEENWLQNCAFGIHFTAGSERNTITGNAFVANQTQVKYAGTKWVDWSEDGRGNYWSNYPAYDLDGDGIAEGQFRPNDAIDHILWTQPAARLLLGSPAVQLVRWSQSAFPSLLPGGVVDNAPLMRPTETYSPLWETQLNEHPGN